MGPKDLGLLKNLARTLRRESPKITDSLSHIAIVSDTSNTPQHEVGNYLGLYSAFGSRASGAPGNLLPPGSNCKANKTSLNLGRFSQASVLSLSFRRLDTGVWLENVSSRLYKRPTWYFHERCSSSNRSHIAVQGHPK